MCEIVEVCPWCGTENIYTDYNVEKDGYLAQCKVCGHQIFLCDVCIHSDDYRGCDWHISGHSYENGKRILRIFEYETCNRGTTKN